VTDLRLSSWWLAAKTWLGRHLIVILSVLGWALLSGIDYWLFWPTLTRPADEATASVIVAAITVNGVLLTAAVTYIGVSRGVIGQRVLKSADSEAPSVSVRVMV
jgi:hypothetical protein